MREALLGALHVLNEREMKIISLRYGLNGKKEKTLAEIGKEFKVTRERIRQLQNSALGKLHKSMRKHEDAARRKMNGLLN